MDPSKESGKRGKGNQTPEHAIRLRNIRAAIWKNETAQGPVYNVTVTRFYRDGNQWKNSNTYGRDDLLVVSEVTRQCFIWICNVTQDRKEEASS